MQTTGDLSIAHDVLMQVTKHITPIVRKADDLNRVVPPKEIMNTVGIFPGDKVEFYGIADEFIIIKKHHDKCLICGSETELLSIPGGEQLPSSARHKVCTQCLSSLHSIKPVSTCE